MPRSLVFYGHYEANVELRFIEKTATEVILQLVVYETAR